MQNHYIPDIPVNNPVSPKVCQNPFDSPFSDNLSLHWWAKAAIQAYILA
jgi:hypothetical protein